MIEVPTGSSVGVDTWANRVGLSKVHTWTMILFVFAVAFLLLSSMPPFEVAPPRDGLDPSWVSASASALLNQLSFGTEFVFTTGPYSAVYTRTFVDGYTLPFLIVRVIVILYVAVAATLLWTSLFFRQGRAGPALISAFLLVLAYQISPDTMMMSVPVLAVLLYVDRKSGPMVVAPGIALSALLILAKFSLFPLALGACVLADILSVLRRDWPYKTLLLAAAATGFFVAIGQPLAGVPAFLKSGLEVTSGYAAAMGRIGAWQEIAVWLVIAAFVWVLTVLDERRAWRAGLSDRPTGVIRVLLLAGFLFIVFKAGFVRHDAGHVIIAWNGLAYAALIFQRPRSGSSRSDRLHLLLLPGAAILASIGGGMALWLAQSQAIRFTPIFTIEKSWSQLRAGARLVADPGAWLDETRQQARNEAELIATRAALPELPGPVDIISSRQSQVIASGLD